MNEGVPIKMYITKDNKLETPRYLEDIPDYEKKLKAWEFLNSPDLEKITKKHLDLYKYLGPENLGYDPLTASRVINKELGFPRTEVSVNGKLVFLNSEHIKDYFKDILGKDNMPLISKNVFKDAA